MPKPKPTDPLASDDEPAVQVVDDTEPAADETGDAVELVRTGWVRFRFGDRLIRLRRPFLGELKMLRLALEDVSDAIGERADEAQAAAARMMAELAEVSEGDEVKAAERRAELKRESRTVGRAMTDFSEEQRLGWWRLVVEQLSPDGALPADDDLPSWIIDAALPGKVLAHWRSVPLGRG